MLKEFENDIYTFRTLVDASPFPVYLCMGEEMIVTIANDATLKAWGRSKDVIGKPFTRCSRNWRTSLLNNFYYLFITPG